MSKPAPPETASASSALMTVLNSLDALIYVADMDNHELLFINEYGRQKWGEPGGKRCWEYLQKDQKGPCTFCTNAHLVNDRGSPTGVYVWEFQNTRTGHWYQCRDEAIIWTDGRLVRIEIATDISERKEIEQALEDAKREAEFLAGVDPLTSLNNRRAFFNLGDQILKEAVRFHRPASLIMFDLDYFKQINDNFGHEAGDEVLRHIARLTEATTRKVDIVARLGGEEFAVLLPQTGLEQAGQLAERLRAAFMNTPIVINGEAIRTTASFGVSSCDQCDELRLDMMLALADNELYNAKRAGRNQIRMGSSVNDSTRPDRAL
ncbi:GGDEF domain-containing protein [Thalassolituus sp. LLYu03]|uniref:GGDEF domain-containing protein n=1 Tax=Thalassolituus sp. LLYu03 TaxID=3421656 RepID=UPI003D2C8232